MKKEQIQELEGHSYGNMDDINNIVKQESEILKVILDNMSAYSVDIINEAGHDYAIVKRNLDNTEVYKTKNPTVIDLLFPKKD